MKPPCVVGLFAEALRPRNSPESCSEQLAYNVTANGASSSGLKGQVCEGRLEPEVTDTMLANADVDLTSPVTCKSITSGKELKTRHLYHQGLTRRVRRAFASSVPVGSQFPPAHTSRSPMLIVNAPVLFLFDPLPA